GRRHRRRPGGVGEPRLHHADRRGAAAARQADADRAHRAGARRLAARPARLDPAGGAVSGVQSVDRALDVLEALAGHGGAASLSEIAATTGLPYGTIHRLLRTLLARGYVRQESDRRYALGGALVRLGGAAENMVAAWARPYLARMVDL